MPSRKAYGYYHGVVLKRIAEATRRDARDLDAFFKLMFNAVQLTVGTQTRLIGGSTHRFDSPQMADFIARVRQFAEIELGLLIPEPEQKSGKAK